MTYALAVYQGNALDITTSWQNLPYDQLRRKATRAAQHLDSKELWECTTAYLMSYGEAGARISEHTLRSYRTSVRQFLAYADRNGVSLLRPAHSAGLLWVRRLEAQGKSAATVRVRLAGARTLFRALRWAGVTKIDPFLDVKPAKDPTPPWEKRAPYREEEVSTLVHHAPSQLKCLLLLCAHAGLRISEALALKREDVQAPDSVLIVQKGKGNKRRRVVLSATLTQAVNSEGGPPSANIINMTYNAARRALKSLCTATNTTYRAWHALRHYAGTRLARETGDLERVARHLGHADIATARIYAKWSETRLHETVGRW